ncbi:MAG: hypothetical protein HDR18_13640 [Lachnospiraceae bacterium]|nr:hypothetical protein [Lachnospiraceae bacterium]
MRKMRDEKIVKKTGRRQSRKKAACLTLSMAMVIGLAGCGEAQAEQESVINDDNAEEVLNGVLNAQVNSSHSSQAGKEETVYVLADAKGSVNQVIVSDWLKNSEGGQSLKDSTDLTDIRNVKGYETFEKDENGDIIWQTDGADIYYRGTTDKEVPVNVNISYQLDGQDISPEELAGRSGRVTIRMDYDNRETRKVMVGGGEQEIKVPFAMISGMILPQDTFSNIEVTNARLLSEGNNSVVVGVAFPGLKESIDADGLKEKLQENEESDKLDDIEIPDYIEVTADTENFELGMTMTVAMSDILSDIELTDSIDLSDLNDSMDELRDATNQLKDGAAELKDGSGQLKDGTAELLSGTGDLRDGTVELKDGTQELYEKSGVLNDGAGKLNDGAAALYDGTGALQDGVRKLTDGTGALQDGSKKLADGAGALKEGGKKLTDGAGALQDGSKSLADGTGALVGGIQSLNDGAVQLQSGINQVAGQMNTLKAGIGVPVTDAGQIDPSNPADLMQVSYLLNQSVKALSQADGLSDAYYQGILAGLGQQKAEIGEKMNTASANLAAAQERSAAAQAELAAACQIGTQEVEIVTDRYTETVACDVAVEAPVYTTTKVITTEESEEGETQEVVDETTQTDTQTITGTGEVEKEVVTTDTIEVQFVNVENLQQKVDAYQAALQEEAACRVELETCSVQLASIEEEITQMNEAMAQQAALAQKWGPAITYAAVMDQKLGEISASLNSQQSVAGMTALVSGAGALADGTQSAFAGAKAVDSGANELKKGIDTLGSGASELQKGIDSLGSGANELKKGIDTLDSGANELSKGVNSLKDGAGTLKDGTQELKDGTVQLVDGTGKLNDGAGTLKDGVNTLWDGVLTLDEGMGTLDEGALALLDGIFEFDEEGISKLTELFGDDVQDVIDRLKAVADAGKEYNTFTKLPENVDGSVKFIIKTEAVEK